MALKQTPLATPQKQAEYRMDPDGVFRTYANNVAFQATSYDLKLIFGEVAEITTDKIVVEHKVQVTMTWLEAKILSDFLQANVKIFEDTNGPLKLPTIPQTLVVPETFKLDK